MKSIGMSGELSVGAGAGSGVEKGTPGNNNQENLLQLWSALRAHDDNTLENMFKTFLGKVFLEMNSQQDVIQAQSERIREINRTEEDRLMDLQKSAESDLKLVIEQYERQIRASIKNYQEKIDFICSERDQLVDELQRKG